MAPEGLHGEKRLEHQDRSFGGRRDRAWPAGTNSRSGLRECLHLEPYALHRMGRPEVGVRRMAYGVLLAASLQFAARSRTKAGPDSRTPRASTVRKASTIRGSNWVPA